MIAFFALTTTALYLLHYTLIKTSHENFRNSQYLFAVFFAVFQGPEHYVVVGLTSGRFAHIDETVSQKSSVAPPAAGSGSSPGAPIWDDGAHEFWWSWCKLHLPVLFLTRMWLFCSKSPENTFAQIPMINHLLWQVVFGATKSKKTSPNPRFTKLMLFWFYGVRLC